MPSSRRLAAPATSSEPRTSASELRCRHESLTRACSGSMRIVQFEIGGATHCGVELDTCVCPPVRPTPLSPSLRRPLQRGGRSDGGECRGGHARAGEDGRHWSGRRRRGALPSPPFGRRSRRQRVVEFLRVLQVVKSGKYRVSKPVKLLAPINGVRASPNLSRPRPRPRRQPQLRAAALSVVCVRQVGKIVCIGMNYVEHCTEQVRQPASQRMPSGRRAAAALRGR